MDNKLTDVNTNTQTEKIDFLPKLVEQLENLIEQDINLPFHIKEIKDNGFLINGNHSVALEKGRISVQNRMNCPSRCTSGLTLGIIDNYKTNTDRPIKEIIERSEYTRHFVG